MMLTRYQMRLRILRAGYSIPHSMEWMFWPLGYRPHALTFTGTTGSSVTVTETTPVNPGFKHEPLARRYKLIDVGRYAKSLLDLRAIREIP